MTDMERIMMKRMEVESKKELEMEKSISIQQKLMKKLLNCNSSLPMNKVIGKNNKKILIAYCRLMIMI